ncbi:MAG: hypothetical protein JW741_07150 [Sedimentisphaerales bacterium]|nr:hypothetical protein [Sedimentisphaerales bacterium]
MNLKVHALVLTSLLLLAVHGVAAAEGSFVFSNQPIDPASPQNLSTRFAAGDHVYGLIQLPRTWRDLGAAEGQNKLVMAVYTTIDSKRLAAYMELRSAEHLDAKHLLFDVAPALDRMTAYRDEGVFYGDAPGGIKKGACQITEYLAEQTPGKHVVTFWVLLKGKKMALGQFQIEGQDYSMYKTLHEEIKKELSAGRPFPAAKMTNKEMEAKMVKLLTNAGWSDVLKLHIVDKDWWIDRVAGGNSPIESRHVAAAAAYKDAGDKYYYKICTFHEQRLITGGFGPLELTHQSPPVPISAKSLGVTQQADTGPDMSGVAKDAQPDFTKPELVLADVERMRKEAMKKRAFTLVGKCSGAATKIKNVVEKNPQGYEPEVKRIWLGVYEEFKKLP